MEAAYQQDIEHGGLQTEIDMFHRAIKKGLWNEANDYIIRHGVDIISQKSSWASSKGWTSLHVAVHAGQHEIMKKLVEKGALLTEKDSKGYTPFALAVELWNNEIVEWMLNEAGGNDDLLTMKINSDDDKGDIPVLLAATKGYKEITGFLFSRTPWSTLLDNNCYYAAKLLSHCIHAEIFGN
jgi:ankyrin repeat protein